MPLKHRQTSEPPAPPRPDRRPRPSPAPSGSEREPPTAHRGRRRPHTPDLRHKPGARHRLSRPAASRPTARRKGRRKGRRRYLGLEIPRVAKGGGGWRSPESPRAGATRGLAICPLTLTNLLAAYSSYKATSILSWKFMK